MSRPGPPKPAKLVIGLFMKDASLLEPALDALTRRFGEADIISAWLPFDFTTYYAPEMGAPLHRRMAAFKDLVPQSALPEIKLFTNRLESEYAGGDRRRVNIDPGYLTHERFVLATGKNFTHRIYLKDGIFADLTLIYRKGGFQDLPWTYPDYAHASMKTFLGQVRNKYIADLKRLPAEPAAASINS